MSDASTGERMPAGDSAGDREAALRAAAVKQLKARAAFWRFLAFAVIVTAVVNLIWFAAGAGYYWPGWVELGLVVALSFSALDTFGPSMRWHDEDAVRREMDRLRRRG